MAINIFDKTYHGFEHFSDYWRDVDEAVDKDFNSAMESVPGEFQGKMRVAITYEPAECETRLSDTTAEAAVDPRDRIKRMSEIAARIGHVVADIKAIREAEGK